MEQNKSFWRKFNPTLKEITEKNPNLSILGIWWAFSWRIWVATMAIMVAFWIIIFVIAIGVGIGHG